MFAGPGCGKSTTAAGLFHEMKLAGHNVELVTEYAKELVWDERAKMFDDQLYILAKQHHKLIRLENKVDFVITDSPLLLSNIYTPKDYPASFKPLVNQMYDRFDNMNFMLKRVKPYNPIGRNQTEEEAKDLDERIRAMLLKYEIKHFEVVADASAVDSIMQVLHIEKVI